LSILNHHVNFWFFRADHHNRVWAWGRNDFGQCGTGSYVTPVILPSEIIIPPTKSDDDASRTPVSDVICGSEHTMVVDQAGHVGACGWNEHGNLGFGDTLNQSLISWIPGIDQHIDQSEQTEILQLAKCSGGRFLIASGGAATMAAVTSSSIHQ
jgi:alpha-tubulin suppressor-like RCC1 family protein